MNKPIARCPHLLAFPAISLLLAAVGLAWGGAEPAQLIDLAKKAVRAETLGQPPPKPASRTPVKPVFVTIERNGTVLGCRGALQTRTGSLEDEVILAARAAARHDPRYKPLTAEDLQGALVTVTVVDRLESIKNVGRLSPKDGLVLQSGDRIGVVLPWEGKDPKVRLEWAYRKAGVKQGERVNLHLMVAERYRG